MTLVFYGAVDSISLATCDQPSHPPETIYLSKGLESNVICGIFKQIENIWILQGATVYKKYKGTIDKRLKVLFGLSQRITMLLLKMNIKC